MKEFYLAVILAVILLFGWMFAEFCGREVKLFHREIEHLIEIQQCDHTQHPPVVTLGEECKQ